MDGGTMAATLAGFPSFDSMSGILGNGTTYLYFIIYKCAKWKFNMKFTGLHSSPVTLWWDQIEDRFLEGKLKKDTSYFPHHDNIMSLWDSLNNESLVTLSKIDGKYSCNYKSLNNHLLKSNKIWIHFQMNINN